VSRRIAVRLTAHFESNLEAIERLLDEVGEPQAFDSLLAELTDGVLPNLQRFPDIGRSFLARVPGSSEAALGAERLTAQLKALDPKGEAREYVMARYLVLYARIHGTVYLLSIRHHRQLSFDFDGLWPMTD
jgi:hypothetical protein